MLQEWGIGDWTDAESGIGFASLEDVCARVWPLHTNINHGSIGETRVGSYNFLADRKLYRSKEAYTGQNPLYYVEST